MSCLDSLSSVNVKIVLKFMLLAILDGNVLKYLKSSRLANLDIYYTHKNIP